jgi:Flp pilus assembly protein TadD
MFPRYLSKHPEDARAHMFFALTLGIINRIDDAKREAAKALELNPSDPLMLYNATCFYSRLGEKALAIRTLKSAFTAGYENYEWLKRDTDLDNIRNEPEYIEFIKGK